VCYKDVVDIASRDALRGSMRNTARVAARAKNVKPQGENSSKPNLKVKRNLTKNHWTSTVVEKK
jgi:hypothetical protein